MGKRKAAALAATAVFTALVLFPSFGENAQIKEEQEKKSALEEEKEKVEAVLKDLESLKSDTAAYVQRLDQDLNALNSELTQLEGQIAAKETDIEAAQAELTQAEAVEEQQYESMKLRIKYMYEAGGTSFMDVLLDAGSISDFLNRTEYISEISKYDREKLDEYVMAKDTVEKKKA